MNEYQEKLKTKMDQYAHFVYQITKDFPKGELYGATSQFRRSSLSVILNYIEGYARRTKSLQKNFLEIAYGSLQESKYLLKFCFDENYLTKENYTKGIALAEEIGAMLWKEIEHKSNNS